MAAYLVRVKVIGNEYFFSVGSEELAQKHIQQIKKRGYRRFEGNACQTYVPDQIIKVDYERIRDEKEE